MKITVELLVIEDVIDRHDFDHNFRYRKRIHKTLNIIRQL